MNELETSYFVNQYPTFVAIFVILVLVIAVLSSVIMMQLRKQNQLRPRYGFLGKPLAFAFFLVLAAGSVGLVYYSSRTSQDVGDVSADRELNLVIQEEQVEDNIYRLKLIPSINKDEWGTSGTKFNVYWTISNTETFTRIELDLTDQNQGGILVELKSGKNSVKAIVFTDNISEEVTKDIVY